VKRTLFVSLGVVALIGAGSAGDLVSLLTATHFNAIRDEASGELPLVDFRNIVNRFTGFAPSRGGDQIAEYIAGRLREYGLSDVNVEGFPADGKRFYWAFLGEPAWEADAATLTMVAPRPMRLSDFKFERAQLGRYSTGADVTTDLVDVGDGVSASAYDGKDVKGKIALVTGQAELAHRQAVWGHGAVGIVTFRGVEGGGLAGSPTLGNRTGGPAIIPWSGPHGEPPGFSFSVPTESGLMLRQMLRRGEHVTLHAYVKATLGPGEYKQVTATIRGTDPSAKEVWIKGHDNYRNGGGVNNLTGVGAVIETARTLNTLIARGVLPRPLRTIRFLWSAEHFADIMTFHTHPDWRGKVLSFFSVDMVGFSQPKSRATPRLTRLPYSLPHFLSDVCEDFFRTVADANMNSNRSPIGSPGKTEPIFAPSGSRDEMRYTVEEFWGPSDHEDMVDSLIGVPAVEYGHPARFAAPEDDNVTSVDPTQMRRAVTIIGATGYYLATANAAAVPVAASTMAGYAQGRMGREMRRAVEMIDSGPDLQVQYREALNVLKQSLTREGTALDTLGQLGQSPSATAAIARARKQLDALYAANEAAVREAAAHVASDRKIALREPQPSAAERQLAKLVVTRSESVRGPVNLFRPEYGAIWLAQKLNDENFAMKLRMAQQGRFTGFEALNFADGKRNMLEIRDLVSAEYGPMDPSVLEEYFRMLERVGVVTISPAQGTR
jgi:hypothetical protein